MITAILRSPATSLTVPTTSLSAATEFPSDVDFFSFAARAGEVYQVSASAPMTNRRYEEVGLYASDGTTLLATNRAWDPLFWLAPADGVYYFDVHGDEKFTVSPYTLDLAALDYDDDHGNLASDARVIDLGSTSGEIEVAGDADFFSFNAIAETRYNFFFTTQVRSGTKLRLFDSDGTTLASGGSSYYPQITWSAPDDGMYFIEVSHTTDPGTYNLELEIPVDDHGDTANTSTAGNTLRRNNGAD